VYVRWVLPLPDDPSWIVPERVARSVGVDAIKDGAESESSDGDAPQQAGGSQG
jgi:hypothetical protein